MAGKPAVFLISLGLIGMVALVYARALHNDLVYDDRAYILENPQVRSGLSRENVNWAFTTTHEANWHPLTWLSLQWDSRFFARKAWGYHVTNLWLHAANSVLIFILFMQMTGSLWRSAVLAALFAVHPLHVESVAWAAERKDVLSTFFGLLALGAYLAFARQGRLIPYILLILFFALSLMAKPMLVTLPFLLLLLDYWPLARSRGSWLRLILEKIPLLLLSVASCWVTVFAQRQGGALKTLHWLPFDQRLENALAAYLDYLGKTFWPLRLAVFYPHPREQVVVAQAWAAGMILIAVTMLVWRLRGRWPYLLIGWLWFVGSLVPVIGLVQVGEQALADRYTYVPLIGLFLILVWGLADLWRSRVGSTALLAGLTAVLLLACMARSWDQVGTWRTEETLWQHALKVTQGNYVAHHNLGYLYSRQAEGQEPRLQQPKWLAAERQFRWVLEERPDDAHAHNSLGAVLANLGDLAGAAHHFQQAMELNIPEACSNLREVYLLWAEKDAAASKYDDALTKARLALDLAEEPKDRAAIQEKIKRLETLKDR